MNRFYNRTRSQSFGPPPGPTQNPWAAPKRNPRTLSGARERPPGPNSPHPEHPEGPKRPSEDPRRHPRAPQGTPGTPRGAPGTSRESPESTRRPPKGQQKSVVLNTFKATDFSRPHKGQPDPGWRPQTAPKASRRPQAAPKSAPGHPRSPQEGPKDLPRTPRQHEKPSQGPEKNPSF